MILLPQQCFLTAILLYKPASQRFLLTVDVDNFLRHWFSCSVIFGAVSFLSLRVFGLLSSSLLLFPQLFGRYVLQPSSSVCRTRELSRNFELCPLLTPRGSHVLILLAITGYKCYVFLYCYLPAVRIEPETSRWLSPLKGTNAYNLYAMCPAGQFRVNSMLGFMLYQRL